ncbi:MAG: tripartite tricarboxylate transporter substrate binding protein, partial [Betaproteobacteria bacterium]|nr:tripartite tricarboxylate transporter substrate binding protein [Betaproteobacteria bacterium]
MSLERGIEMNRMLISLLAAAGLAAAPALAQNFPNKPVRIVVPTAPGGGTDVASRGFAKVLSARWNQSVIVENRTGANGSIGVNFVVKSDPDGYTLGSTTSGFAISASTEKDLPYNPRKDVAPLLLFGDQPLVLIVGNHVPANNIQEFAALARAKPGTITLGSSDPSTVLANDILRRLGKIDVVNIDYKGTGQIMIDTLGGTVSGMITSFAAARPQMAAGKIKGLAVTTMGRSALAPDLPSLNESIAPGYDVTSWYLLYGPSALPKDLQVFLNKEIIAAMETQDMKDLFGRMLVRP